MANPLQQASVRRKAYYVAGILALFTLSMVWRGKVPVPLSNEARAVVLNKLRRLDPAEQQYVGVRLDRGEPVEGFEGAPASAPTRPGPNSSSTGSAAGPSRTRPGRRPWTCGSSTRGTRRSPGRPPG